MDNNFSVPKPCPEKWDSMNPQDNGRYCGSCQKVVIDFTNKTKEEILEYIRENSGKKMCGTFKNTQLPSPTSYQHNEKTIRFLASLLLVFGMTLFSCSSVDLGDREEREQTDVSDYRTTGDIEVASDSIELISNSTASNASPEIITAELVCETTGMIAAPENIDNHIEITMGDIVIPTKENDITDSVLLIVDQMPEFPGGNSKMMEYLLSNIRYPKDGLDCAQGTVYLNFIVRKDGRIDNVQVLRGVNVDFDNEAMRVVKSMPNWIPGKHRGQLVNVGFNLPIKLRLK